MAIQGARELRRELAAIGNGEVRPVYLVFGSEGYLVRTAADAIASAVAERSGAEVVRVDAAGLGPEEALEPLLSLSLFAPARVAIVRNFAHLLAGENGERLLRCIDRGFGEGSVLVLAAPGDAGEKVDKRLRGTKGLVKRGAAIELDRQKPRDLAEWLRDQAAREGKRLAPEAAERLLARVGPDMQALRNELDKALLFCLDREGIEAADIEALTGKSREEAAWSVAEAVVERRAAQAMELLGDLLAGGTYPLVVLTLLVRQVRHLLQARLLWERAGRPRFRGPGEFRARVASAWEPGAFGGGADDVTSIHPFAAFRRFETAARHEPGELAAMLVRLRRADREAKTGAAAGADRVLEGLVLELCARAAPGAGKAA